jgi:protein-S-isoprenylcysteine O-methyltransferase Ste14
MRATTQKGFLGMAGLFVSMAALLFMPPWTLHYWQAWLFLAVFIGSSLLITLYLMKNDPTLLEHRINAGPGAERQSSQKVIQSLARIFFGAFLLFPAIDHRFAWSKMAPMVSLGGDLLVILGYLIIWLVFKENRFTSGTIEIQPARQSSRPGHTLWSAIPCIVAPC